MEDPFLTGRVNRTFPKQEHLKCPRCDSSNTKFCYYNNYNLSQPRHYCKNCKRYWTKGGVLRNIPVGGGSRKKSKRSSATRNDPPSSSTSAAASSSILVPSVPSSMGAIETDSSYSLKVDFDKDCKMLELNAGNLGTLEPLNEEDEEAGSEEVRNVDDDDGNSTTTTSCWNRGNWPDLAM